MIQWMEEGTEQAFAERKAIPETGTITRPPKSQSLGHQKRTLGAHSQVGQRSRQAKKQYAVGA